jgi:hypothetical protein
MTQPISLGERDPHPDWPNQHPDDKKRPPKKPKHPPTPDTDSLTAPESAGEKEEPASSSEAGGDIGTQVDFEA